MIQLGNSGSFTFKCPFRCEHPLQWRDLSKCLSVDGFAIALRATTSATATHGARLAAAEPAQADPCELALETALGMRCPTCKVQFHEFDACMSVQCDDDNCPVSCACCMAPIGFDRDQAHAHIMGCPKNLIHQLYSVENELTWEMLREGHILAQVKAAWALLSTVDKERLDARSKPIYDEARALLNIPIIIVID